jgi:hypothetical protein
MMHDPLFLSFFLLLLSGPVLFVGLSALFQSLGRRRVGRNRLFRCLTVNSRPSAEDSDWWT